MTSDRRAIFLSYYTMTTRDVLSAIRAGDFDDPALGPSSIGAVHDYYLVLCLREVLAPEWRAPSADDRQACHLDLGMLREKPGA